MKSIKCFASAILFAVLAVPSVFAGYSIDGNSTITSGDSLWNKQVLTMTASLNGTSITFTVSKIDGGCFTSSGKMYLKVGAYQDFGHNRDSDNIIANVTCSPLSFTHDLDDYPADTYPKEFYFRYVTTSDGNPDGGWAWVGPIWVSYEPDVDTNKPSGDVSDISSSYSVGDTISCTLTGEDDTDLSKLTFQIHVDNNPDPKDWDEWNVSGTWTEKPYSVSTLGWDAGNYEYFYWVEDAAGLESSYNGSFSLSDSDSGDGSNDGNGDGSNDGSGDGSNDGSGDGSNDGSGDGSNDGNGDGSNDGNGDGSNDGNPPPPPPPPTAQYTLTVSTTGLGSGEISSSPSGINCSSDCSKSYEDGTSVILQANPDSDSNFTGWSGACEGIDCELSMISDQDVTANFEPSSYSLTVTVTGDGKVTSSPSGIDCGSECSHTYDVDEQVTLTASPEEGLVFAGWSGVCEDIKDCVVSMASTQNVTATFQQPRTLILTNRTQLEALYSSDEADQVMDKLDELAKHPDVQGLVIQVEDDEAVAKAYEDRAENYGDFRFNCDGNAPQVSPEDIEATRLTNVVTSKIKQLVIMDNWDKEQLQYIVIAGDDRVIPFHRLEEGIVDCPDYEEDRWILTDDFYVDNEPENNPCIDNDDQNIECIDDNAINDQIYMPDIGIGRLIENPTQIINTIDNFITDSTLDITSAAFVGDDFLSDSALDYCNILTGAGVQANCATQLIAQAITPGDTDPSWTAEGWTPINEFIPQILNQAHDITTINLHADFDGFGANGWISSNDIQNATANFTNTLVYTVGCHSGENRIFALDSNGNPILDSNRNPILVLDLAEAFSEIGANYIANTGYGYGGVDTVSSELLMNNITENIAKNASISLGNVWRDAKTNYYSSESEENNRFSYSTTDEKVMAESVLYGLPMYTLKVAQPTVTQSVVNTSITETSIVGETERVTMSYSWEMPEPIVSSTGTYYTLDGKVTSEEGYPVLPKFSHDIRKDDKLTHGIVFKGGNYDNVSFSPPLQELFITEDVNQMPSTSEFTSPNWYPSAFFSKVNLSIGNDYKESMNVTAGQYNPNLAENQQRIFTSMDFDVYYHADSDDWTAPTTNVENIKFQTDATTVTVTASDESGVQAVLVTFTDGEGTWNSVELTQQEGETWQGSFTAKPKTQFFVQGVDKAGNVLVNDNDGKYFDLFSPLVIVAKETGHNKVAIIDAEGELLNSFETESSGNGISISTGDFNDDGEDEVVVNVDKQISIYKLDGTEIFKFLLDQEGDIATGDYDGDGLLEFFTTSKAANTNNVSIYAYDGTLLKTVNIDSLGKNTKLSIATADTNGDGIVEIIAGDLKGDQVAIYSIDGTEINTFTVFQDTNTRRRTVRKPGDNGNACDHKGQGQPKFCDDPAPPPVEEPTPPNDPEPVVTEPAPVVTEPTPSNQPETPKPSQPKKNNGVKVAAGDINGDGVPEIIVGMASKGSTVEVYNIEGERQQVFATVLNNNGVEIAAGDVNKDGKDDIIVGDAEGTQVVIFDLETQIAQFQWLDGKNIASIAFGKGTVEITNPLPPVDPPVTPDDGQTSVTDEEDNQASVIEPPSEGDETESEEDKTDAYDGYVMPSLPPLPLTGDIIGTHHYGGETITDGIIDEDANLSNVTLAGDITNEGRLSNITVSEGATLQGGVVTGDLTNNGIVKDITFVGHKIEGGELGGIITINAKISLGLGILTNVTLQDNTTVKGGHLKGKIKGKGKALIEKAKISADAELSDVIIGAGCQIAKGAKLGMGVRFISNDIIPIGMDLTMSLSVNGVINFNTDVVQNAPNLLFQVNDMPDMQDNNWQLVQNTDTGQMEVTVDNTRLIVIPKRIKQTAPNRRVQIIGHGNGKVTVITAQRREILVQLEEVAK